MIKNSTVALPSVNIARSKFKLQFQHKTTFNLGELVPVARFEVLPGSTWQVDLASFVRSVGQPITALMDNLCCDVFAFFVPHRLAFKDYPKVHGENDTNAWVASEVDIPYWSPGVASNIGPSSLGSYLGMPVGNYGIKQNNVSIYDSNRISVLPGREYGLIWNEFFRSENLQNPLLIYNNSTNQVGDSYSYHSNLLKVNKYHDLFTDCLPQPQKGGDVLLPLGSVAPVYSKALNSGTIIDGSPILNSAGGDVSVGDPIDLKVANSGNGYINFDFYADLASATAASINNLRYAFQVQRLLEKDALYGTRYTEMLAAHFGVTNPDSRLQRPELLAKESFYLNVEEVLQTTGFATSDETSLGSRGGNLKKFSNNSLFTKSFTEFGSLFILACVRQDQSYSQGLSKQMRILKRLDNYYPVFANIGNVSVLNSEIYLDFTGGAVSKNNDVFGYQEAWYQYRDFPNLITGLLNPSASEALDFWTLANKFDSLPTLSGSFIQEDRTNFARCFSTGLNGPDFVADFLVSGSHVEPMPVHSIPGLIDHH